MLIMKTSYIFQFNDSILSFDFKVLSTSTFLLAPRYVTDHFEVSIASDGHLSIGSVICSLARRR